MDNDSKLIAEAYLEAKKPLVAIWPPVPYHGSESTKKESCAGCGLR